MSGTSLVAEIVEILVSGITGIATGIGTGLSNLVKAIFLVTDGSGNTQMSEFGIVIVVFAGIALAIGLSRLVVSWLTSLGGSNM